VPTTREQGGEPLPGMDAMALKEQLRVRIGICWVWWLKLDNMLFTKPMTFLQSAFIVAQTRQNHKALASMV